MKRKHFTKKERIQKEALTYMSRRDLLSLGIKMGSSALALPMVKTLFHETSAFAEIASGTPNYPVIQFHLSGGAGNNMAPRDINGNILTGAALAIHGVNPATIPMVELFGTTFFDRTLNPTGTALNGFIAGLRGKITDAAKLSQVQAFSCANDGQDDNNTDAMGCNSVLSAAGFKSPLVDAIGISRTDTGMNNSSVLPATKATPFIAPNPNSIKDLLLYSPAFANKTNYTQGVLENFSNALKEIGGMQAPRIFNALSKKDQLVASVNNAHTDNFRATVPSLMDFTPSGPLFAGFDNLLNAAQLFTANGELNTFLTAIKAMTMGQVGFAAFNMPDGYDYHGQDVLDDGNNKGTHTRDRIAGEMVGAIINLFLETNSNAIIILTSDGACSGKPDHTIGSNAVQGSLWTGDRGQLNLYQAYVVSGTASSLVRETGKFQIGAMRTDTGTVDTNQVSGKGDLAAGAAVAANILSINGVAPDQILKIFPTFGSITALKSHLIFKI